MQNPITTFYPATNTVPSTKNDVFVISENGMIGTGHYHRHNGKGEWRVSFQNGEWYQPVWWAHKPDTSEEATGYKFNPEQVITC